MRRELERSAVPEEEPRQLAALNRRGQCLSLRCESRSRSFWGHADRSPSRTSRRPPPRGAERRRTLLTLPLRSQRAALTTRTRPLPVPTHGNSCALQRNGGRCRARFTAGPRAHQTPVGDNANCETRLSTARRGSPLRQPPPWPCFAYEGPAVAAYRQRRAAETLRDGARRPNEVTSRYSCCCRRAHACPVDEVHGDTSPLEPETARGDEEAPRDLVGARGHVALAVPFGCGPDGQSPVAAAGLPCPPLRPGISRDRVSGGTGSAPRRVLRVVVEGDRWCMFSGWRLPR